MTSRIGELDQDDINDWHRHLAARAAEQAGLEKINALDLGQFSFVRGSDYTSITVPNDVFEKIGNLCWAGLTEEQHLKMAEQSDDYARFFKVLYEIWGQK